MSFAVAPNARVILIHYANEALTLRALKCVQAQPSFSSCLLTVVDNGSPQPLCLSSEAGNIQVLRLDQNVGYGAACQRGLDQGLGASLDLPAVILSNDLFFKEDLVAGLVHIARERPRAGIVGPRVIFPDGRFQLSWGDDLSLVGERIEKRRQLQMREGDGPDYRLREQQSRTARAVDWVTGAAFLITRTAQKKIESLDGGYHFYYEDCDWCHRVRDAGLEVVYDPTVSVTHELGATLSAKRDLQRDRARELGHLRYYARHQSVAQFFGVWILVLLKALKQRDWVLFRRGLLSSPALARSRTLAEGF